MADTFPPRPYAIPDQLRPQWEALSTRGASKAQLAATENYLAGDAPMTSQQMDAAIRVAKTFPNGTAREGWDALTDHVMDSLQGKYKTADDAEKEKIFWVARSLFLARFERKCAWKFDTLMRDKGDIYLAEMFDAVDKGISAGLQSHRGAGHVTALMQQASYNKMVDFRRETFGRHHDGALNIKHELATALSLDDFKQNNAILRRLRTDNPEPLQTLTMLEDEVAAERKLAALTPEMLKLTAVETKLFPYFLQNARGERQQPDAEIGRRLALSTASVKTHLKNIKHKCQNYFGAELPDSSFVKKHLRRQNEAGAITRQ